MLLIRFWLSFPRCLIGERLADPCPGRADSLVRTEPRRLRHLIGLGALTFSSARNVARALKADEDVGVPRI